MTEYEYRGYTIRQYPHLITVLNPAGKLLSYWTDTRLAAQKESWREHQQVDERDGGWETWLLCGHVQKADGSVFTDEESDALIDDFLGFMESKGLGFGGGLGTPGRKT